jgi:hypothetical protein
MKFLTLDRLEQLVQSEEEGRGGSYLEVNQNSKSLILPLFEQIYNCASSLEILQESVKQTVPVD